MAHTHTRFIDRLSGTLDTILQSLREKPSLQHYLGFDCPSCKAAVGLIPEATFGQGEFNSHEDPKTLAKMKLWVCPCCESPFVSAPVRLRDFFKNTARRCCVPSPKFELKVLRHPQHIRAGKIRVKRRCERCGITRHTFCYVPRLGAMISLGEIKRRDSGAMRAYQKGSLRHDAVCANV